MQSLTQSILQHTQEVCATLIPIMESTNAGMAYTTSMQLGDYTFTITLNKKTQSSVLGKRPYEGEDPIPIKRPFYTSNQRAEFELPHSDHVLYITILGITSPILHHNLLLMEMTYLISHNIYARLFFHGIE